MYEDCPSYRLYYAYDANGFLSGIRKIESGGLIEDFGVHCNIFGDVITIYAEGGNVRAKYTYDSWGKILSVTDAYGNDITGTDDVCTHNSIRYRGYVYDEETGLYYLQSRYYDPNTGRFINADGMLVATNDFTINLFAYAACNPIVNVDPEGTCPYNGTVADFYRLEYGLPSLDCTCVQDAEDRLNITTSLIETGTISYFDDILDSIIQNASLGLNSGLDDIYNALGLISDSFGLVSLFVDSIGVIWDYNTYKDDMDSFWTSTNITIISTGISIIATAIIAACEFPVTTAFVITAIAGIGISWIEDKMRKKLLN